MAPIVQFPNLLQFTVTDGNAHTIPGAKTFIGFVNLATTAQTAGITAFDNTAASGTVVGQGNTLSASGAAQQFNLPNPGLFLFNGLTVQASAAPTAPGIMVLYTAG